MIELASRRFGSVKWAMTIKTRESDGFFFRNLNRAKFTTPPSDFGQRMSKLTTVAVSWEKLHVYRPTHCRCRPLNENYAHFRYVNRPFGAEHAHFKSHQFVNSNPNDAHLRYSEPPLRTVFSLEKLARFMVFAMAFSSQSPEGFGSMLRWMRSAFSHIRILCRRDNAADRCIFECATYRVFLGAVSRPVSLCA